MNQMDLIHGGPSLSWIFGIFFWLMILIGIVVLIKSAFKGTDK